MITALAIVPGAPLLLPEHVGRVDPLPDLRSAARAAVFGAAVDGARVVVVTATDVDPRHRGAPIGSRIAVELLGRAPDDLAVVPWDASVDVCRALGSRIAAEAAAASTPTALIVVADGCATRTEKAPGHLDARSREVDRTWLEALGADESAAASPAPMRVWLPGEVRMVRPVDPAALLGLDPALAAELQFQGRAPLQVLATAMEGPTAGRRLTAYELMVGDPFGVRYVVMAAR